MLLITGREEMFQNRGALHIHMLLWVDNSELKEGEVSAIVRREVDDVNLREIVLKYQIHSCRPGRCFNQAYIVHVWFSLRLIERRWSR